MKRIAFRSAAPLLTAVLLATSSFLLLLRL